MLSEPGPLQGTPRNLTNFIPISKNAVIPIIGSRNGSKGEILDGGFKISTVQIVSEKGRKKSYTNAEYEIYDTRMKILLSSPLKPNGGKLSLKIDFSFISPQYGSDRMGVLKTKKNTQNEALIFF